MGQPNRAAGVAIALAIVVSFLPALILPYGNTDDYIYLAQAVELGLPSPPYAESVMHAAAAEGRPFWGTLVKPVFAAAGMIDNLRFVRIVTVAGIVALALLLYWALVRSKIGRLPAVLIALLVCTLPPFQLYASWAITFSLPWAALAGGASLLAGAAVDAPRRHFDRLVWATALLTVAADLPAGGDVLLGLPRRDAGRHGARFGAAWRLARVQFAVAAVALGLAYLGSACGWSEPTRPWLDAVPSPPTSSAGPSGSRTSVCMDR